VIRGWRHQPGSDAPAPVERPAPALDDDHLLIAVEAAVFGAPEIAAAATNDPCIPGGAAVGVVEDGLADWVGRRVLVDPESPCGECDVCRRGGAAVCPEGDVIGRTRDGALATAVVARARWVCAVDGELSLPSPAAALAAREAAHAYAMFARAGVGPGEPVVVVGDGVIARFLVDIAAARGTRPLVLADDDDGWRAHVERRGGLAVVAPTDAIAGTRDAVARAADGAGLGRRPWRIFETSADAAHRALALSLAGPAATVTLLARRALGAAPGGAPVDLEAALDRGVTVLGVAGAHPDFLPEVAALAVRGDLDLDGAARLGAIGDTAAERARWRAGGRPRDALVVRVAV
jgi:6-hydroxycyclohex-1-ene-1-carbonyl-CoA dehydrogenase